MHHSRQQREGPDTHQDSRQRYGHRSVSRQPDPQKGKPAEPPVEKFPNRSQQPLRIADQDHSCHHEVEPNQQRHNRDRSEMHQRHGESDRRRDRRSPDEHLPERGGLRGLHSLKTQLTSLQFSHLTERAPAVRTHSRFFTNRQFFEAPGTAVLHRLSIRTTGVSIPCSRPNPVPFSVPVPMMPMPVFQRQRQGSGVRDSVSNQRQSSAAVFRGRDQVPRRRAVSSERLSERCRWRLHLPLPSAAVAVHCRCCRSSMEMDPPHGIPDESIVLTFNVQRSNVQRSTPLHDRFLPRS